MTDNRKPVWHGIVLIAGGSIGAGVFALPMVAAGMWFSWAVFGLIFIWAFTFCAAKLLAEVNFGFPVGASFHTIVRNVLGPTWAWINDVSIAFIMVILMYAYITAGAGIIQSSLSTLLGASGTAPPAFLSVVFAVLIGVFVWLGTTLVSRITSVFLLGLALTFVLAIAEMMAHADWQALLPSDEESTYVRFLWSAIPVFVTAFACAGLVPSLVQHYQEEPHKVTMSLFCGTLAVLLIYGIWLATSFSSLAREEFGIVIEQGGKIEQLVGALRQTSTDQTLAYLLKWFSHFAIVTSFLSIGLGLFHFLSDALNLRSGRMARAKAAVLTFLPPALMSVFLPYGFVKAIGLAGLLVAFSFFIVPAWMYVRQRGVHTSAVLVMCFGVLIATLKVLLLLKLLPEF